MMRIVANRRLLAFVVFALVLAPASFVWLSSETGSQLLGQIPPVDPPPEDEEPPAPTCDNGLCQPGESNETCPEDCPVTNCGNGVCEPNEITSCADDCAGAEECDDGNSDDGDGCSAACTVEVPVPVCGDGEITDPEVCDDGNSAAGDGCSATCEEEICGNSIMEFDDLDGNGEPGEGEQGEQCDDGNTSNGDGCTEDCQMEFCGDGTIQEAPATEEDAGAGSGEGEEEEGFTGEECDDGNQEDGDGCSSTCREERCGDGKLDAGEECDDSNNADEDGCNKECMKEFCGDGTTQASLGEECDVGSTCVIGGAQDSSFDCRNNTECNACIEVPGTSTKRCGGSGNGLDCTDDPSVCDNSTYTCNVSVSEECTPECTRGEGEGTCGNNELEGSEECDDGNSADGDGCSKSCLKEFCGDGEVTEGVGEQCDNGGFCNQNPSQACRNSSECTGCIRIPGTAVNRCGGDANGALCQNDEECADSGYTCEYDTEEDPICNEQCEYIGECGNGTMEGPEECDDGNAADQDGCSRSCELEFCGDGEVQEGMGELCDNGKTCSQNASIGCSADGDCRACLPIRNTSGVIINNQKRCGGDPRGVQCNTDAECANTSYTCQYDDDNPGCDEQCQITEFCEDNSDCPEGEICEDGQCTTSCGNGDEDPGEDCDDGNTEDGDGCSAECTVDCEDDGDCPSGLVCIDGTCENSCGNGEEDDGENCSNCPEDMGCGSGTVCCDDPSGVVCAEECVATGCVNDGTCSETEDCDCPDCETDDKCIGCNQNDECDDGENCRCSDCEGRQDSCQVGLVCEDEECTGDCGNGEVDDGETCLTCPIDAGCGQGQVCCEGSCAIECDEVPPTCGNGTCDAGENCECEDCDGKRDSCANGFICQDGVCTSGECGDGVLDGGETCLTCPADAGCGSGTQCCEDGSCAVDCVEDPECNNNRTCDAGESCACPDCQGQQDSCEEGLVCIGPHCSEDCGNDEVDAGETCLNCPIDAGCANGTQCCADGTCAADCSEDPPCNNNGTCNVGESCACPDCEGDQDSCLPGLVCIDDLCTDDCGDGVKDPNETCLNCPADAGCGNGTQCCADGTCSQECAEQPECNEDGTCDRGENCECPDCLNQQDSCRPRHFCDEDGLCHPTTCGNGTVEGDEECDDDNSADGDGCSKVCLNEFCGDGEIQTTLNGETCDNGSACLIRGTLISSFDCRTDGDCQVCLRISGTSVSRCGGDAYGKLCTEDEECVGTSYTCEYNTIRNASCGENCLNAVGVCGNGTVEGTEECDDSNSADGDGCSKVCLNEFCGDGKVIDPEQCDNGSACSNNSAVTCRTDAQCRLCKRISGTSVSRCGGDPYGTLCTSDAACTSAPYTCEYDVTEDAKCNAACENLGTCGNGTQENGETCLTCPDDAGCGNSTQCCADGTCALDCSVDPPCNDNNTCDVGESCACPDCNGKQDSCLEGFVCIDDLCSDKCGNGSKDAGETCLNCPHDAGCGSGTQCCADGSCAADCPVDPPCNNNNTCDVGESCACPDCDGEQDSCLVGLVCEDDLCEGDCGNGTKDSGETCLTCPSDAGCANSTQCCADGTCAIDCAVDPPCDEDSICDVGESCACADCDGKQDSCLPGLVCESDHCSDECGDGSLDPGETCLTCPADAGCASGTQCCSNGSCAADCGEDPTCDNDNTCDVGESCACPDCDGKQDSCRQGLVCEEEVCEGDCGNGSKDPGETCGTCAADAGCSQGQQCCSDGTCKEDCGGNQQCDEDNVCETGEGCGCDDCAGKQDGCQVGFICEDNHCEPDDDDPVTFCGNGRLELPAEECDDGNNVAADGCDRNCLLETLTPVCGDALIVAPEECDDGNQTSGDGCSPVCTVEQTLVQGICGDGILNQGEQCDDNNQNNGDGCNTLCQLEAGTRTRCGDGILTAGEQCDDGNGVSGDGCSLSCRIESTAVRGNPLCGNGVRDAGEECDDGNARDVDGCSATCFLEKGYCGDGIVQHALSEQCEPSTHDSSLPYGCKNDCRFALRFCGNERLDAGEECDLGTLNSDAPNSMCRKDCSRTRCGDSILDGGEMCDDGNVVAGDGCDRQCRREAGAFSGDASQWPFGDPNSPFGPNGQLGTPYQYGQGQYPMYPNTQPLPYNLPLAQVATGNISGGQGQIAGDTGPVAVSVMAAGAAAGFAWMRRRRGL